MSLNPITRKQRWSEAEGRQVVDEWRRSGLSPADFARRHGLAEVRLLRWRARLEEQVAIKTLQPGISVTVRVPKVA